MKKIMIIAGLLTGLTTLFAFSGNKSKKDILREKQINITIVSTTGCTVQITGTINYNLIPPKINSFQGTVTLSGPAHCPHAQLPFSTSFRTGSKEVAGVVFDTQDLCAVSRISWLPADKVYADLLNDAEVNKALVKALKTDVCEGQK